MKRPFGAKSNFNYKHSLPHFYQIYLTTEYAMFWFSWEKPFGQVIWHKNWLFEAAIRFQIKK